MSCTQAEISEAFRAAMAVRPPEGDDAMTTQELSRATGRTPSVVRLVVRELLESGAWEHVKVIRLTIGDARQPISAFRPVERPVAGADGDAA